MFFAVLFCGNRRDQTKIKLCDHGGGGGGGDKKWCECEHFLNSIVHGTPPRTDGNEGLQVLKILKASQRSMDEIGKNERILEW